MFGCKIGGVSAKVDPGNKRPEKKIYGVCFHALLEVVGMLE